MKVRSISKKAFERLEKMKLSTNVRNTEAIIYDYTPKQNPSPKVFKKLHYQNSLGTNLELYLPINYSFESAKDNAVIVKKISKVAHNLCTCIGRATLTASTRIFSNRGSAAEN